LIRAEVSTSGIISAIEKTPYQQGLAINNANEYTTTITF